MIDVTDVAINEQKKEVIITGIDVDKMWEHHEGEAKVPLAKRLLTSLTFLCRGYGNTFILSRRTTNRQINFLI